MRLSWNRKYHRKETAKEKNAKKKKDIEFKWSKIPTPNQKQLFNLQAEITHLLLEYHTPYDIFSAVTK